MIKVKISVRDEAYGSALCGVFSRMLKGAEITADSRKPEKNSVTKAQNTEEAAELAETIEVYGNKNYVKFILSENNTAEEYEIYKYGSFSSVVMKAENIDNAANGCDDKELSEHIISCIGSRGGCGQSVFCMALAQELTRYHGMKCLYINLCSFSDALSCFRFDNQEFYRYLYSFLRKKQVQMQNNTSDNAAEKQAGEANVTAAAAFDDCNPEIFGGSVLYCDEYGVRYVPGFDGINPLSSLNLSELYAFFADIRAALGADYLILDLPKELDDKTAGLIENSQSCIVVVSEAEANGDADSKAVSAAFAYLKTHSSSQIFEFISPFDPSAVEKTETGTKVHIDGAYGSAVKEFVTENLY